MILAVHGGASIKRFNEMLEVCGEAVNSENAISAINVLEENELFNCGVGSNLNLEGDVECEASYMTDEMKFGAVGCVSNCKTPSKIAFNLANDTWWDQRHLLHPLILVGAGAEKYAQQNGVASCSQDDLKTITSIENHRRCIEKLESQENHENQTFDTVGAISWNSEGPNEAICSSGGIILKNPGRLGHSCIYGSGAWAQTVVMDTGETRSVSICSTGHGEVLVKNDFCREISRRILSNVDGELHIEVIRKFLNTIIGFFGGIALISENIEGVMHHELLIFHNCPFLPVAIRQESGKVKKIMSKFQGKANSFTIKSMIL